MEDHQEVPMHDALAIRSHAARPQGALRRLLRLVTAIFSRLFSRRRWS
jgi:hypothetical protein